MGGQFRGASEKLHQLADVRPLRPFPGDSPRIQEAEPAEEVVRIASNRQSSAVTCRNLAEEERRHFMLEIREHHHPPGLIRPLHDFAHTLQHPSHPNADLAYPTPSGSEPGP